MTKHPKQIFITTNHEDYKGGQNTKGVRFGDIIVNHDYNFLLKMSGLLQEIII